MRLSRIKLSGFKSFVDPTTILVPGQRLCIVGPNGCGKSNVIDAIRWVLGESSARHLRGDSMEDVIFNGSTARKPVGRTSVELHFDNSLGKAGGAWAEYAEIAVKRVLQRGGESAYYVNNLHVRRRDVVDIFLGTGLAGKHYAIIEQDTISRLLEAKPEELRQYLEEAAGVSKYRERRRETESRLKDTRDNLSRVEDIRQELEQQVQKLEAQAEVARQYLELQHSLQTSQNLLWLLKKREALIQRERAGNELQRVQTDVEGRNAQLRSLDSQLEATRQAHLTQGDALHAAQSKLYEASAEVARLEQHLEHLRETRQRLLSQIEAERTQHGQSSSQLGETQSMLGAKCLELGQAQKTVSETANLLEAERNRLTQAETLQNECQQRNNDLLHELAELQTLERVEEAHLVHALKTIEQLADRRRQLEEESKNLALIPSHGGESSLAHLEERRNEAQTRLQIQVDKLSSSEESLREAQRKAQELHQSQTHIQAQLETLRSVQEKLDHDEKLDSWLKRHQMADTPRLWRNVHIHPGWETALENVLGEHLSAIAVGSLNTDPYGDAPPGALTLYDTHTSFENRKDSDLPHVSLSNYVSWHGDKALSGAVSALLSDWLHDVYVLEEAAKGWSLRRSLPPGAKLVCREGHVFTRSSVAFSAAKTEWHGVLSRQREIEALQEQLARLNGQCQSQDQLVSNVEQEIVALRSSIDRQRGQVEELQTQYHTMQLEVQKLAQQQEHAQKRKQQLGDEIQHVLAQSRSEEAACVTCREKIAAGQSQLVELNEVLESTESELKAAESAVASQREKLRLVENEHQTAKFNESNISNKINELYKLINNLLENLNRLAEKLDQLNVENAGLDETKSQEQLSLAVANRFQQEQSLSQARDKLAEVTNSLQQLEQNRMLAEHELTTLREKLGQVQLKEQEHRLAEEQYDAQLKEALADEAQLTPMLDKKTSASALQGEITRLKNQMEALGAVNLAAVQELQTASERKAYLDAQFEDLNKAIETLEQAIRRIDKETRERLLVTYEDVNKNLAELFVKLFGGGQARLVLTGDEILDAGLELTAQPPGKKNASIHPLSGGEKALTALALTFALFQLNPAPFCLLDEVDAPLDENNTLRFCDLLKAMSERTQFMFISHNKTTMEIAEQLIGVTMQESGVSRVVAVDVEEAMRMRTSVAA